VRAALQDMNASQYSFLKSLYRAIVLVPGEIPWSVTVVGDDDQCIYEFTGAYVDKFDDFPKAFVGAHRAVLTTNYRCVHARARCAVLATDGLLCAHLLRRRHAPSSHGRSSKRIVAAANALLKSGPQFVMKDLTTLNADGKRVVYCNCRSACLARLARVRGARGFGVCRIM
jgi:superfamily I DNA/RNA helicase